MQDLKKVQKLVRTCWASALELDSQQNFKKYSNHHFTHYMTRQGSFA